MVKVVVKTADLVARIAELEGKMAARGARKTTASRHCFIRISRRNPIVIGSDDSWGGRRAGSGNGIGLKSSGLCSLYPF